MNLRQSIYLFLLIIIIIPSCINEDMSDCYTPKRLDNIYLSYKGDGYKEIFFEKIENINLYAFDENENLVQTITLHREDFNNKQSIALDLPEGKYDLVCWANIGNNTQINMDNRMEGCMVGSPNYFKRDVITTNDTLYFGRQNITIPNGKNEMDTIAFKAKHRKMQVLVDGLENTVKSGGYHGETPFLLEIENLLPAVTFNQIYLQEKVSYFPVLGYHLSNEVCMCNFSVFPFQDDNDIVIKLKNASSNEVLHTVNLKDFMIKNNISVTGKNEVKIGIRFFLTGTTVSVSPWDEETISSGTWNQ